jgi:hypothetical protein
MRQSTAFRLQAAMRAAVQRGTAKSIAKALADTGWQMGGKTGSGGSARVGPQSDGWFVGLIFDPQGKAQFTVATFVRHAGPGGGTAARISADLARYIIGLHYKSLVRVVRFAYSHSHRGFSPVQRQYLSLGTVLTVSSARHPLGPFQTVKTIREIRAQLFHRAKAEV